MFRTKLWPFCCYRGGGGGQLSAVKRTVNVLKNAGIFFVCVSNRRLISLGVQERPVGGKGSHKCRRYSVSFQLCIISSVKKRRLKCILTSFFWEGEGPPFRLAKVPQLLAPPPPFIESKGELLDRLNRRLEFVDVHSPVTYKHMT